MSRPPRVFISRTTAGLKDLAEQVAEVLRHRGIDPIIQTGFYPSTHDVKSMLAEHLQQCDAVICLIGSAYGSGPHDSITKAEQPVQGLKDPRTKDRLFSYTQLELLIARDLGRPIYTFFIQGDELPTAFATEPPELAQRQQTFITEFAKDGRNTYGTFSQWDLPAEPARGLKQAIEAIKFEITVLAGKPTNLPYTSLGTLFKGRDEFLAELRQHLTAEGPVVIKGKRTIHGMGGVGKTRAAIEYAWKHADDYRALLFISADTPEALHRNLAALCGPLVLNLPEQNEKEQALQVEAALRWMKLHPGWFLIIDNVDTNEAAEETKALLAKLNTGHVLITSRISDWTGHVKSLDLDVLSQATSIAFLDERTEERRPKKDDDREQVGALVKLLDCLALALEQAGAHISTNSISYADYIALWESHRPDALAWHDEEKMKYPRSLAITYETSVGQLSDGAKELFHTLAWFAPDPVPRSLLEARPKPADEKRYLGEIERLHLARYLGDGKTFAIHRLNQEITRQQQIAPRAAALDAALHWIDGSFTDECADTRNWGQIIPLSPHANSVAIHSANLGVPEPTANLLGKLSIFLEQRGAYREAEIVAKTNLELCLKLYGEDHLDVAACLNNLAEISIMRNHTTEVEARLRRAISIMEKLCAKTNPKLAIYIHNLAKWLSANGRFPEAEPLMREALAITEHLLGESHPKVAIRLQNLALLLKKTNRTEEAERLYRRALDISKAHYGEVHPSVAVVLNNLGQLLQVSERFVEAESCMRQALAIDRAAFETPHTKIATRLHNLAHLMMQTGRTPEAEPLLREAVSIDEVCLGAHHYEVALDLVTLAKLCAETGREVEGEALVKRSIDTLVSTFGGLHHEVANACRVLAKILQQTRRLEDARSQILLAISIDSAIFGENHPSVAKDMLQLGLIENDRGDFPQAQYAMKSAVEICARGERGKASRSRLFNEASAAYVAALRCSGWTEEAATREVESLK